jgi:hypothetical protein
MTVGGPVIRTIHTQLYRTVTRANVIQFLYRGDSDPELACGAAFVKPGASRQRETET